MSATVPPLGLSNKATSDGQDRPAYLHELLTGNFQLPLSHSRTHIGRLKQSLLPLRFGQK
jgi:hypothetical protein